MNDKDKIVALREALESARQLISFYHGVFSDRNFTDRYNDAARCENAQRYFTSVLQKTESP